MEVFCDAVSLGVAATALLMLWSLDSCYSYTSVLGESQREVLTDTILAELAPLGALLYFVANRMIESD